MKKIVWLLVIVSFLEAREVYATFNVVAQKSANLAFTATEIVNDVKVDIGSVVKKGSVLATLKNDDIEAMLKGAKVRLKFAKKDFLRQQKIKKLIDATKFDRVSNNYESALSNYAYQQALYNKTFLKAPFDGVIYDKNIEIGDAVSGMMLKTVFKIQSLYDRKLILEFDQKYVNIVKIGQKFLYKIDGDNKQYSGVISKIYPFANTNNRKIKAEVKAKDFVVGMFGNGTIYIQD